MGYKNLCTIKAPQDIHQAVFVPEDAELSPENK